VTPKFPLAVWAPDADPTTPGIMTDVEGLIPTSRGYAPDFSLASGITYTQTLPAQCRGAGLVQQAGNFDAEVVAGTASNIYVLKAGGLILASRSSPAYTTVTDTQTDGWRFGAFGATALAISYNNALQSTANLITTPFADISGGPTGAGTMAISANFVVVGNISDAAWPYVDGYWTCALQDVTDWVPDVATFASRGRLMQTPGAIVRMIAFGDDIIAFKSNSIVRGTFTGDPSVPWAWRVVSTEVGLVSHDAVCEAENVLYWLAADGFYAYNGGSIRRIESAPWEWFKGRAGLGGTIRAIAQWDVIRRVVRWYFEDSIQTAPIGVYQGGIAYHPGSDQWGRFASDATAVATAAAETVPSVASAARSRPNVPLVFEATTFKVQAYRGPVGLSTFSTHYVGDDERVTVLTGARVRMIGTAVNALCLPRIRQTLDDGVSPWTIEPAVLRTADGRYDMHISARWHQLEFRQGIGGMFEILGFMIDAPQAGKR